MKRKTMKKRYPVNKKVKKRPLFWSSLVYSTNMTHAFISGLYLYSFCFASLTITSLVVHTEYNIYTNIIDKLAIASIVIYGGYRMWNRKNDTYTFLLFLCFLTFFASIGLYTYNTYLAQYNPMYHVWMHWISSIGHHIILLL